MARPPKLTVEFFSHDANASESRTLSILFNNFGHDGLSAWWLLLERLAKTRNHYLMLENGEDMEFLAASMHFTPERLKNIISKMAEVGAIDPELYKARVIWCQHFVDRLEAVYATRKQELPLKPNLIDIIGVGVTVSRPETELSGKETELSGKETELSGKENLQRERETKETILKRERKSFVLPDWIDKELWDAFLEMRKKIKAPNTEYALKLLISELTKLKDIGDDPNELLKRSIMNGWKGVFSPRKEQSHGGATTHKRIPANRPVTDADLNDPDAIAERERIDRELAADRQRRATQAHS